MRTPSFKHLEHYTQLHFELIKKIYLATNSDEKTGIDIMLKFITPNSSNKRIAAGSMFYEIIVEKKLAGILEFENHHLTLLYLKNEYQKLNIGSKSIAFIKSKLESKHTKISVLSSINSKAFYLKNNFTLVESQIQNMKGLRFYKMEFIF